MTPQHPLALCTVLAATLFLSQPGAIPMAEAADPAPSFQFTAIDGGSYDTAKWRGKPVLVVNTASMCGYTPQYTDLQALVGSSTATRPWCWPCRRTISTKNSPRMPR